jgi:hypothetical protein
MLGLPAAPALAAPKRTSSAADVGRKLPDALRHRLEGSGLPLASFGVYAEAVEGSRPLVALNAA